MYVENVVKMVVYATKLSFWDVFWGFSAYYCVRKFKASYFQLSTLIWLVGLSLVTLPLTSKVTFMVLLPPMGLDHALF